MSIPTSLIVVVLVLAWLMVLVPMVSRRREAVPEAEMVGGTFRVLRRSSEPTRRRPSFRRSSVSRDEEVLEDADPETDSSALDEELLDDDEEDDFDDDEYAEELTDESTTESTGGQYPADQAGAVQEPPQRPRSTGSHPYRAPLAPRPEFGPDRQPVEYQDPVEFADDDLHETDLHKTDVHETYLDETDLDETDQSARNPFPGGRLAGSSRAAGRFDDDDARGSAPDNVDELHLRPIPRRAGRGGYDPDAAEVARAYKYSRRRRVTVVLLLTTLVFSAAASLLSPVLWAGAAVFGVLLIAYLAYLRRQVQIEASIRERRLARLRRARQIRPESDMDRADGRDAGASKGRADVAAAEVAPTGYRRGREIVDQDDDDPAFDDLEYYQPLSYRRASGQ